MKREVDFICSECHEEVFKCPPGAFQVPHRCLTPEERAERERAHNAVMIEMKRVWMPMPPPVPDSEPHIIDAAKAEVALSRGKPSVRLPNITSDGLKI